MLKVWLVKTGEIVTGETSTFTLENVTLETIKSNLYVYAVGAIVLSIVAAIVSGALTYLILSLVKPKKLTEN